MITPADLTDDMIRAARDQRCKELLGMGDDFVMDCDAVLNGTFRPEYEAHLKGHICRWLNWTVRS